MGQKFIPGPRKDSIAELAARLGDIVGLGNVVLDPQVKSAYERDWTGRFTGRSALVARPGDAQDVPDRLAAGHGLH
jgi:FAD/FMN-containing dehydrogenase